MFRQWLLGLAAGGLRMPVGADLVLREHDDSAAIEVDGRRLGGVIEEAARRYRTPLAIPLMDLRLEKADLLGALGISAGEADAFHFETAPGPAEIAAVTDNRRPFAARNQAHIESVRYIAECTDLAPVGMAIGPFSLMTKLLADPIVPLAAADEEDGVHLVATALALAEAAVARSLRAQIEAGAKAILVCEPAANRVFISPRQMAAGSTVFERFVMQPNRRLKQLLESAGVALLFHNCGELVDDMVRHFASLHPAMLSLGSSRCLWRDAALVVKDVVLYGNLPTKNFYSDAVVPLERVDSLVRETIAGMREVGHPHILGSECDVLHVPDAADTIRRKVDRMMTVAA